MSEMSFSRRCTPACLVVAVLTALAVSVSPSAAAAAGYQLDSAKSSIFLTAELPLGIAIDQTSQDVYVAEGTKSFFSATPGQVEQLSSSGTPTADSPFNTGAQDLFTAVAVNPLNHGIYAYQPRVEESPMGPLGVSKMSFFSSSGVLGSSFSPSNSAATSMAVDATGRIVFPSSVLGAVLVLNSSGGVEATVTCSGCAGGSFAEPTGAALDSAGNLYVVDKASGGRVVKLAPSGASFVYQSTLQSGAGAKSVGVDPSGNDVFVSDKAGGAYHVVAYNSSGVAFDDFGLGLATEPSVAIETGQLAANATTHKLYMSDTGGNRLWVFERIASIPAPTASVAAPSGVGQVEATLRASVNSKGHVLTACHFEYTDHADFLANGYVNAQSVNCPGLVGGSTSTTISAKATGLTPATDYDYRVQVADYGGGAESGPQSFETLPALPPEATTTGAVSITTSSATLKASVNPKGGAISSCRFEYVTEAASQQTAFSGAATKACSPTPSGNAAVAVSANVSGLAAGTAYRYRVVATSNSGTTPSSDTSFATTAESCSTNPALCPPSGGESAPAVTPPSAALPPPSVVAPQRKPLKCHKGFKRKRVRGKLRCVKVKKRRHRR
jgi:hypothetical protein